MLFFYWNITRWILSHYTPLLKVSLQKYALMYANSSFKTSDYSFYSPTLFIAPTRSTCPSIPLEIIYIRSAAQSLQHAHSSPLVLPQHKHFMQKDVLYVRYNAGARRSQHILICVHHILPRQLAQWSLQRISLLATRIPCHFIHSAYCPPVIPCDVTLHYTAYTTEYTKRWLSFRSPINMLACICTPALNKHKYPRFHTTIGTFIIRMGQFTEMLCNRSIHYAVCIFRYFAT